MLELHYPTVTKTILERQYPGKPTLKVAFQNGNGAIFENSSKLRASLFVTSRWPRSSGQTNYQVHYPPLIATLTRRLCTEFVDPLTIEPTVASRLITLDKGNVEVRPIGVGAVIRKIIGKCVTRVAKQGVINASGAMQVCAGQKSGGEAAIHAMRNIFEADETDAALLVDASNAFNSLNRAAALNYIRVLCPLIATYVTNTYRVPARLFVVGGSELKSAEGTT